MDDAKASEIERFQKLTITLVNKAILINEEGGRRVSHPKISITY